MNPLITIGITCFNAEKTIAKAIQSAQSQTYKNFEILIIDDGSTDDSIEIIKGFIKQDNRIKLIKQPENKGFPSALNTIMQNADGELVALFDDDDVSIPVRLVEQYERIIDYEKNHPSASLVICFSNRNMVDDDNPGCKIRYGIGRKPPEPYGKIVANYALCDLLKDNKFTWGWFGTCAMMARKTIFLDNPFDINFRRSAEIDLWFRLALKNTHFISVDKCLITQYITTINHKSFDIRHQYCLELLKKHKLYLQKQNLYLPLILREKAVKYKIQGKKIKRILCLFGACLLSPNKFLPAIIQKIITAK